MKDLYWNRNVNENGTIRHDKICNHCGNNGIVLPDDNQRWANTAVPCPACTMGAIRNSDSSTGDTNRLSGFWQGTRHPSLITWEHGLSLKHRERCGHRDTDNTTCFTATVGGYCSEHAQKPRVLPF